MMTTTATGTTADPTLIQQFSAPVDIDGDGDPDVGAVIDFISIELDHGQTVTGVHAALVGDAEGWTGSAGGKDMDGSVGNDNSSSSSTASASPSPSPSSSASASPSESPSPSPSSSPMATPEASPSPSASVEDNMTPSASPSTLPSASPDADKEASASPSPSPSVTPEASATPIPSPSALASPSASPEAVASPSASPEVSASPSALPEASATPSPSPEAMATPTPTPAGEADLTTPTPTPNSSASVDAQASPSPSASASAEEFPADSTTATGPQMPTGPDATPVVAADSTPSPTPTQVPSVIVTPSPAVAEVTPSPSPVADAEATPSPTPEVASDAASTDATDATSSSSPDNVAAAAIAAGDQTATTTDSTQSAPEVIPVIDSSSSTVDNTSVDAAPATTQQRRRAVPPAALRARRLGRHVVMGLDIPESKTKKTSTKAVKRSKAKAVKRSTKTVKVARRCSGSSTDVVASPSPSTVAASPSVSSASASSSSSVAPVASASPSIVSDAASSLANRLVLTSNTANYGFDEVRSDLLKIMDWAYVPKAMTSAEQNETVAAILSGAARYFPELSTKAVARLVLADIKAESDFNPRAVSGGRLDSGSSLGLLQVSPGAGAQILPLFQQHARVSANTFSWDLGNPVNRGPLLDYRNGQRLVLGNLTSQDLFRPWINVHIAMWLQSNLARTSSSDPYIWPQIADVSSQLYDAGSSAAASSLSSQLTKLLKSASLPRSVKTGLGSYVAGPAVDGPGSYTTSGDDVSAPYLSNILSGLSFLWGKTLTTSYLDTLVLNAGLVDYRL